MLNVVLEYVFSFGLHTNFIDLGPPDDCKLDRNPVAPDISVLRFT